MTKNPMYRLYAVAALLVILGVLQWQFNLIPIKATHESVVPLSVELPTSAPEVVNKDVAQALLPSSNVSTKVSGQVVRALVWEWNAQMGLMLANGGPKTTTDSLMEKNGVKLNLIRQDDTDKMKEAQIKFAQKLANGDPNPSDGAHFVVIMGDQSAGYIGTLNKAIVKLGPEYRAEVIGAVGWSGNKISGEDSFMGPEDWKTDPSKSMGGLVAGAVREGDWNIAQDWLNQNSSPDKPLKNNPDETTWDAKALNWVNTDYIKAAELYNTGYCEDRKVSVEGKIQPGSKKHVCVQGVVTWTPGDVNIVHKRGGLVKILSTKENVYQMPAVVIGIHKWNNDHAKIVQGFLQAAFDGADQVRNFEPALQRAGKASYAVYNDESAAYWVRYYRGIVEKGVPLGGSRVANFGDNLALFGLADGTGDASSSMFRATYEGFGKIVQQQYPKLLPDFPSVSEATNLTFLQAIAATTTKESKPDLTTFDSDTASTPISDVVTKRDWTITFETGKATFTPAAQQVVEQLYFALVRNNLSVQIDGHTDNAGSESINQPLSKARANAVKAYLHGKSPKLFPDERIGTKGYGASVPVEPNTTAEGRALNRRVTITAGNK